MTLPRYIIPGSTYLITRRTSQRKFLLKPDEIVDQVIQYCFARAAQKYHITVHCLNVISNHIHAILTDIFGVLPEFLHDFHHHTACCLNEHYDRQENFWDNSQTSVVRLVTPQAVLNEICYAQINSVKAGLVRYRQQWPGIDFGPNDWLKTPKTCHKPKLFFNQDNDNLQQVELQFSIPDMLMDGTEPHQIVRDTIHFIDQQEREVRREFFQKGRSFLGAKKVLRTNPFDSPKSKAPKGNLSPRVAAANKEKLKEAIKSYKTFLAEYRSNRMLWEKQLPHIMPVGTFWLKKHSNACCAPFDPG